MSQATPQNTEDNINLKEIFFSLLESWKIIGLCILLTSLCAVLYLQTTAKQYQTDALVQIKSTKASPLAGLSSEMAAMASLTGLAGAAGGSNTQAELELLKSRTILGQAIQDLNLDLQIQAKQGLFSKFFSNDSFEKQYTPQGLLLKNAENYLYFIKFEPPKALENRNLNFILNQDKYTVYDEKTEKLLIQGQLGKTVNKNNWKIQINGSPQNQAEFLIQKNSLPAAMSIVKKNFNAQENGKGTGIIELTYQGENKTNIPEILNTVLNIYKEQDVARSVIDKDRQVQFLEKQLPELKNDLNVSENQFNQFREKYGTIDVKEESELYLKQSMQLETQKIELQQKQAELSAQYTSEHPEMTAISAQLEAINSKINELNSKLKQLPEIQRSYLQYYRDVEIKTQLYTSLLGTYQSLNVAKAGELGKVSIVDYAVEPVKPIKPRKLIILILSIFVGGFIGVLIALLRSMSKTGVKHREEVEQTVGIPTYVELPQSKKIKEISIQPLETFIPTLRYQLQQKQHNVTLLSSIIPDQNQTVIAKHLAIFLSQIGGKVLLIDADLYQGQLDQNLKVTTQTGLSDYLRGQTQLEQIISQTSHVNLSLIARGQNSDSHSLSTYQEKIAQLMQQVKTQYDYVIISTAPILASSDSLNLTQFTGFNLAIVQYGKTQLNEIEKAKSYFENAGFSIDGVIFDQIPSYQLKDYHYQTKS
jgi:tyrosine-protein kinase Etk/Wzc